MRKTILTPMGEGERSTVEIIAVISSVTILSVALLMFILIFQSKMSQSTIAVPVRPPTNVAGIWTCVNTFLQIINMADDNSTFICGKEKSAWSGTFEGTSYDIIIITNYIKDYITFEGWIDFDGKVKDKVGSLVIIFHGKAIMKYGLGIVGQWSISSGTGDLANLSGEGSFWGWGGYLEYSGKILLYDLFISG